MNLFFLEFKQYGFIFTHLQLAKYKTYDFPRTFMIICIRQVITSATFFISKTWFDSFVTGYFVYFILFESLYVCTKIFYMVNKTIWEACTGIVNTIEFPPINFPQELKTIVYIWLNFLIDHMSWKIRCDSFFHLLSFWQLMEFLQDIRIT